MLQKALVSINRGEGSEHRTAFLRLPPFLLLLTLTSTLTHEDYKTLMWFSLSKREFFLSKVKLRSKLLRPCLLSDKNSSSRYLLLVNNKPFKNFMLAGQWWPGTRLQSQHSGKRKGRSLSLRSTWCTN